MKVRLGILWCLVLIVGFASAGPGTAVAHQSPPGCNTDSLNPLSPNVTVVMHRNGQVLNFDPGFRNPNPDSCDVTGFKVSITFPKPDGTAGGTAETQVVAENQSALGGSGNVRFSVPHTVEFNDGVYSGPVTVTLSGGTNHGVTDFPEGNSTAGSTLSISRPHVSMTVTADATDLPAVPAPVTYTYMVHNDSTTYPGDTGIISMVSSKVTDDGCVPVTYISGDFGYTNWLDVGETWTFTCTSTISHVGTIVNHASYSGTSLRDSVPVPITATAEATVVAHGTDFRVALSHQNLFVRGKTGTYTAVARNSGDEASTDPVTVDVVLPAGLKASLLSGPGWTCSTASLTCSRADPLAAAASYPPVTVETGVGADAPGLVTTTASVSSASDDDNSNNAAADPTTVVSADPDPEIIVPAPDRTRPTLTKLKLSPSKFRAASRGPTVSRKGKVGTKISWTLSEAGLVKFTAQRRTAGRRSGKRCERPKRSNRKGKHCARWVKIRGSFRAGDLAGPNSARFRGRLGGKKLKPGRYRLIARGRDNAGNLSGAKRRPFTIKR